MADSRPELSGRKINVLWCAALIGVSLYSDRTLAKCANTSHEVRGVANACHCQRLSSCSEQVDRQPTLLTISSFLPALIGLPPMPQRVMRPKKAPVTCRKGGGE